MSTKPHDTATCTRDDACALRRQMKNAAKAKQAALAAEQQRILKERAERAQKQRLQAALAKKAAREKQTAAQASSSGGSVAV